MFFAILIERIINGGNNNIIMTHKRYDDMHDFMMNLPWPFPKNDIILTSTPNENKGFFYDVYKKEMQATQNFMDEYNCTFYNREPQPPKILNILEDVYGIRSKKEDSLLPGSDKPILEFYDGIELEGYSYHEDGNYWSKPIFLNEKEEKINHVVSEHQKYMKLLRKYNRMRQKIMDLTK